MVRAPAVALLVAGLGADAAAGRRLAARRRRRRRGRGGLVAGGLARVRHRCMAGEPRRDLFEVVKDD